MIRFSNSIYQLNSRSKYLLKYKQFFEEEFTILDATCSSNGKEQGCIIYILDSDNNKHNKFECRPIGSLNNRIEEYKKFKMNPNKYIGCKYTVKFQEKTPDGIPRFPIGKGIRIDI